MFWSRTLAFAVLVHLAASADPLSRANAESAVTRLKNTLTFTDALYLDRLTSQFTGCTANAQTFVDSCSNVTSCRQTDQNGAEQDKPNDVCCDGGNKECNYDANGNEYEAGCCETCANQTLMGTTHAAGSMDQKWKDWCTPTRHRASGIPAISICGTTQGKCQKCMAGSDELPSYHSDKSNCESHGKCTIGSSVNLASNQGDCNGRCMQGASHQGHITTQQACVGFCHNLADTTQTACEAASSTWQDQTWETATYVAGVYTLTSATTEAACKAEDTCNRCEGCASCPGDMSSCERDAGLCTINNAVDTTKISNSSCQSSSGTWVAATWATVSGANNDNCHSNGADAATYKGSATWVNKAEWKSGEELPVPGDGVTGCSTGPSHAEPSHVLPTTCVTQDLFLSDVAAGKTVTAAKSGNSTYYNLINKRWLRSAALVNHATVTAPNKAMFTLTSSACFTLIPDAKNHGKFILDGGTKTFALITNPTNYADAESLEVRGGGAVVLGGSNAGDINSTTAGSLELYGLINSGNVIAKNSQSIIIADVMNNGGDITVDNVSVTLINVKSSGAITATGANSKYNAYDITNTGTINIAAGTIDLHFTCNTGGTITIGDSVTGAISYENGCKGTITAPSAVTLTELSAGTAAVKVTGNLKLAVPSASASTFKTDPKVKTALQTAIAAAITGVDMYMVNILQVTDARRLSATDGDEDVFGRRLTTSSINVEYEITLPKDNSVTVENVQTAMLGDTAKTTLKTNIERELTNQGVSATITVEETTAAKKVVSGTSFAQLTHMFHAVVLMGMAAVQLMF